MKKILSLVIALAILVSVFSVFAADDFASTQTKPDTWAAESVQKAKAENILEDNKSYNYTAPINREEFCELVYNLVANVIKAPIPKAQNNFTDTNSIKVNVLCDMGIINGKSHLIFAPDDYLTREEAATIIIRMVNAVMSVPVTEMYFTYDDENLISPWAKDSIQTISNMGVMQGTGNNKFTPKGTYTVQEAIVCLTRLCNVYRQNYPSHTNFTDKFISQMPSDKNYMFSPLSVKMALALAANGASGNTKDEITLALGIDDLDSFNTMSENLISRYSQTENLSLNVANSIWINSDRTSQNFSTDYKTKVQKFYNADAKVVNSTNAVRQINSWVNEKTKGKISKITDSDDFWASLINAVYFKAAWQDEFSIHATQKSEFTSADETVSQIDFMNKTSWKTAYVSDDLTVVKLDYKNRFANISSDGTHLGTDSFPDLSVSMYLLMSDSACPQTVLDKLISSGKLSSQYVKLSVPKFKIEFETGLNDILKNLGIKSAFNANDADFTQMFDKGNMFITDTIHKTYISVDEKGTEAAAVTAIGMAGSALPPEPVIVNFNKPFYFLINDNTSGETLFAGRYAFAK